MRNLHYKNKSIRVSEEIWELFKEKRERSGKSWNKFIGDLIKKK